MISKSDRGQRKQLLRHTLRVAVFYPVFLAIYCFAFWLRFDNQLPPAQLHVLRATIWWVALAKVAVFGWFRVSQPWSRFVTFHDLVGLAKAATAASLLLVLGSYLFHPSLSLPRSVVLLDWGMTIMAVGGLLSLRRLVDERRLHWSFSEDGVRALIVGTNDSGEALLRAIRRNRKLRYRVVGFVTEDARVVGSRLSDLPVLGSLDETCRIAMRYRVREILITAGELSGQNVRRLVQQAGRCSVNVKVLPSYEQLLAGQVNLQPRTVSIEDLLCREPVRLDQKELHRWICGQDVLVTGSAGSIGGEICRQLLAFGPRRLVAVDRAETGQFYLERELKRLAPKQDLYVLLGDVSDRDRMRYVFERFRPQIVFHAAAYKHVPLMEANPGEAVKNITLATRLLADLANQYRADSFVLISTDKAVNPSSVMGACKRLAELYIQSLAPEAACRFVTVRFGNVLDSAGSVVPIFREQIAAGGPVTVTHPEMKRYFMTIPEASQLVIQAGAMGVGGEIFVLDMGQPVKILDLAKDMIRLSGLQVGEDIDIEFIGVRPGEKLCEQLHTDASLHLATSHPKILVAEPSRCDRAHVLRGIDSLAQIADGPTAAIVAQLQRVVPEFSSAHASSPAAAGSGAA